MKFYSLVLPVIVFSLFGYGYSVLHRAADDNSYVVTEDAKEVVKADIEKVKETLAKVKPSTTFVYND